MVEENHDGQLAVGKDWHRQPADDGPDLPRAVVDAFRIVPGKRLRDEGGDNEEDDKQDRNQRAARSQNRVSGIRILFWDNVTIKLILP